MSLNTYFDSGEFTGWAQRLGPWIVGCGLVHVVPDRPMADLPPARNSRVTIEQPIVRRQGKTVDPNKLGALWRKVGRLEEIYLLHGNEIELIWPMTWKGSVPKDIQNARDAEKLAPHERVLVDWVMASISEGKRNNIWDAIGIALWDAKRKGER